MLDTGARASKMTALKTGDLELGTGSVLIRQGRGRKPRVTFLGAIGLRAVKRYLRFRGNGANDSPLWATEEGGRLTYCGQGDIVRRRAKKAGVKPPPLHAFRRGFAVNCYRNGMDIETIRRLTGHS